MVRDATIAFLKKHAPFSLLSDGALLALAEAGTQEYYPQGRVIVTAGTGDAPMHVIKKGSVELIGPDGELVDLRAEGAWFGEPPGREATVMARAAEDAVCYAFPAAVLARCMAAAPEFALHFYSGQPGRAARATGDERAQSSDRVLFTTPARNLIKRELVTCPPDATVTDAARRMRDLRVGALVIWNREHALPEGILTNTDLRSRVLAEGRDHATLVREVMSAPVATIDGDELAIEALMRMVSRNIHHLLVVDGNGERVLGLISTHDLTLLQSQSPLLVSKEIQRQRDIPGLAEALRRAGSLAPLLVREGARPDAVGRIVAEVNDQVTRQIASIVAGRPASDGLCWVAMGSEARREQAFKTDQDNALILAGDEAAQVEQAAHFAAAMNDGLIACGTPECPGGFMARNARWRLSVAGWQAQFDRWFAAPEPAAALEAAVFFDMRPVWGNADLFAAVRDHALAGARKHPRFLRELARQALQNTPPLGFFRGLLLERGGPHKGAFDIKKRGVMPISDLARVLALQHGVQAVNTRERLHDLRALGVMDPGFISELMDAHEFLALLRLRHQATQVTQGEAPDNFIAPANIGALERATLREAFQVIAAAQADLTERHGLGRDL